MPDIVRDKRQKDRLSGKHKKGTEKIEERHFGAEAGIGTDRDRWQKI